MRSRELPDFDTMVEMHRKDPDALEQMRLEMAGELLANASDDVRRRLEGLQFRINMELRRARTPEARCVKLSTMMHDSFARLNHCLHNPYEAEEQARLHEATILELKPGSNHKLN